MPGNAQELRVKVAQELSPHLLTVMRLLQMDMQTLSDYMLEMSEQNPALEWVAPAQAPKYSRGNYRRDSKRLYDPIDYSAVENVSVPDDPRGELSRQIRLMRLKPSQKRACLLIVDSLDDKGYFTRDTRQFAEDFAISEKRVLESLAIVQSLDPAGVGARDLSECLALQIERAGLDDPLLLDIVKNRLSDALKRGYAKIAAQTGQSAQRVKDCARVIAGFNPRPCDFSGEKTRYVCPDYEIKTDERGQLVIISHDERCASLRLDGDFARLYKNLSGEDKAFARKMSATARQIIRAVETRRDTMEKILSLIVRQQSGFFKGECELMPLRCDDIARELGVHESTVYRCVGGKYINCPRGTLAMSYFLQRSCGSLTSEACARELIKALCADGIKRSDREISEILEQRGISLARRTIAKYRRQMSISSSYARAKAR